MEQNSNTVEEGAGGATLAARTTKHAQPSKNAIRFGMAFALGVFIRTESSRFGKLCI
jgi:hypothetical protein